MAAKVDQSKCAGCGYCSEICPTEAITLQDNLAVVNEDACIDCGACVNECPQGALSLESE